MVSTEINRIQYSGNGVTTAFSFPAPVQASADLIVITTTSGVDTIRTLTSDYTLTGVGTASSVTVTFLSAPANGTTVTIYRSPAATQSLDLTENSNFPQESVETALDKLAMISARVKDAVTRCIRYPESTTTTTGLELSLSRNNTLLGFDASGNPYLYALDAGALELIAPVSVDTAQLVNNAVTSAKSQPGPYWYAVATYSSAVYSATWSGLALSNLVDGCQLSFRAANNCADGPISLNVNVGGFANKKILRMDGTNLVAGDIISTAIARIQYSSTADGGTGAWLLQNPYGNPIYRYGAATLGGGDTYAVTPTVSVKSLASLDGQILVVKIDADATVAPVKIAVSGLTAKKILNFYNVEIGLNRLTKGQVASFLYDNSADGGAGAFYLIEGATNPCLIGTASGSTSSEIRVTISGHSATAPMPGVPLLIKSDVAALSASPMTLKVTPNGSSAFSALAIKKRNGVKPDDYDWRANDYILVAYNGTDYTLISHDGPVETGVSAISASANAANSYAVTLPRVPRYIRWVARCKTADGVYAVGDEVDVDGIFGTGYENIFSQSVTHSAGTVTLYLGYRTDNTMQVFRKTDGALQTLTQANWEFKCYYQL